MNGIQEKPMLESALNANLPIGIGKRDIELVETKFKEDRFYVTVKYADGKQVTMPRANISWLEGNPSFKSIPTGYVIHHLDYNKTNDDISNLVLMYKFHHVAHHWKQKKVVSKVDIDDKKLPEDITQYSPIKKPYKYYHKPARRYYVGFSEKNEVGRSVQKKLWRRNGKPMFLEEDADKLCEELWNHKLSS